MSMCNNCGSFVTRDFARVFGTNEDEVYGCPDCTTMSEIRERGGTVRM